MTNDSPSTPQHRHGSGLAYSLALFLAHEGRFGRCLAEIEVMVAEGAIRFEGPEQQNPSRVHDIVHRLAAVRWFSQAAGPIGNLVIPESLPEPLRTRLVALKKRSRSWSLPGSARSGAPSHHDVSWALDEARELVRLIDEHYGVPTVKEDPQARLQRSPCVVYRG